MIVPIQRMPLLQVELPNGKDSLCLVEGTLTIKASQEWLKKLYSAAPTKMDGFFQVFSPEAVGGTYHLAWAAIATLAAQKSNSMHAHSPEMEFLCRVAGTFQIPRAQERVGIRAGKQEIVLVFVGTISSLSKNFLLSLAKELDIASTKVSWGKSILPPAQWKDSVESFAIERSALCES